MVKLIEKAYQEHGCAKILDVGGRSSYWKILPPGVMEKNKVRVTVLNLACDLQGVDDDFFEHKAGDACDLRDYPDNSFHIVHSNSVIEHVGGWPQMKAYAREVRRMAPKLFVQTPYYWFPMEPHYMMPFYHWLPKPFQVRLLRSFRLGNRGKARDLDDALTRLEDIPRMLDQKTFRFLFPDCHIAKERFFLLTKSMIAIRGLD